MIIREQEPLARHTTLRTGGPARYFIETTSAADLEEAARFVRERRLPVKMLGGGSNVLAADAGFNGAVMHVGNRGHGVEPTGPDAAVVVAEAGEEWDAVVASTVAKEWQGLENLSLIPGTVGGAVAGNIGAYGVEVQDVLRWVETLDIRTGQRRRLEPADCGFGYRQSFFKTPGGRPFLIIRAAFGLRRPGAANLGYRELAERLAARGLHAPGPADVREAVIAIRRAKLPDPAVVATAGSFFKNPIVDRPQYEALAARYPGLPGHPGPGGRVKIPLGWILDKICGLRGCRKGRVGTYVHQALVIVNEGGTAAEVEALANFIAHEVHRKTGIEVEWEVEKWGELQEGIE